MTPTATRSAAVERLATFVPLAGLSYSGNRNRDPGPAQRGHVSRLSPYLRHRVLAENEVLRAVLDRHGREAAGTFVQEVFWRSYFKGWLELRPSVWSDYRDTLAADLDAVATQSGLRQAWEAACRGETGIACFDAWARELVETGYLHNHARMSLASIWIFTLGLPWTLGADFFIRHLFDGDPASNTLGWRWVAGLQTRGKPYLASAEAIAACTDGRFRPAPEELAMSARQIDGPENPPPGAPPEQARFDPAVPTAFLLHEDDLSPDWLFRSGLAPLGTGVLGASTGLTPLRMAPRVLAFREALARDAADRLGPSLGSVQTLPPDPAAIATWARGLGARQIVTAYAPVGAVRDVLDRVEGLPVIRPLRDDDLRTWPHATAGYFKFRKRIPEFLDALDSVRAA